VRLFFVAVATGGALALALPGVTALTTAVAEDWIATDRPVQLMQKPVEKADLTVKRARKNEAAALATPGPQQADGNVPPALAVEPVSAPVQR
jgi:hypothetical protein